MSYRNCQDVAIDMIIEEIQANTLNKDDAAVINSAPIEALATTAKRVLAEVATYISLDADAACMASMALDIAVILKRNAQAADAAADRRAVYDGVSVARLAEAGLGWQRAQGLVALSKEMRWDGRDKGAVLLAKIDELIDNAEFVAKDSPAARGPLQAICVDLRQLRQGLSELLAARKA